MHRSPPEFGLRAASAQTCPPGVSRHETSEQGPTLRPEFGHLPKLLRTQQSLQATENSQGFHQPAASTEELLPER